MRKNIIPLNLSSVQLRWGIILVQLVVFVSSLSLLVLACILPALNFIGSNGIENYDGFTTLWMGWMGIFIGQFGWYANPFIFFSTILFIFRRWFLSILFTVLSLLISLSTLALFYQEIPGDEANVNKLHLVSLGPGYYLWIASMSMIGLGSVILWFATKQIKDSAAAKSIN